MRPYLDTVPRVSGGDKVAALRSFKYENLQLEQGEVFDLRGRVNDQVLCDHGYLRVLDKRVETWPCSGCGKSFAIESQLRGHQRRVHGGLSG